MNRMTGFVVVLGAMLLASFVANGQKFTVLHSFTGGPGDGLNPDCALVLSGSTLYGTSRAGGSGDYGTVYKIGTNGSGYSILMMFPDQNGNGQMPQGLTCIGSTLYGTTSGFDTDGTVFEIGTQGTGYSVLHAFSDGTGDGWRPYSDLTLGGTNLYGTTYLGGSQGDGTVFQIGTNGSGYRVVYSFSGSTDGGYPDTGSLALSGSTLYGMAQFGGSDDDGSVFKVNTNGSGFAVLHSFTGASDGEMPWGSVTLSGSTLYGMTYGGGSSADGTIFKVNIDGSGYDILHSFTGSDGKNPFGDLILSGSTIYGEAAYGDYEGNGSVFQLNTDGSGFRILHSFTGVSNDGGWPYASLLLSGSTLYGTTYIGGTNNDGTIFALTVPEPSTLALLAAGALGFAAYAWRKRRRDAGEIG